MKRDAKYVRWFNEIKIEDVPLVGGKNASLGEMYRELTSQGVKIPNGFAVTAEAYWLVVKSAGILDQLKDIMAGLDKTNVSDLATRGKKARDLILSAGIPDSLWTEIKIAYEGYVRNTAWTQMLRYGVQLQPKISLRPLLPVSKRLI